MKTKGLLGLKIFYWLTNGFILLFIYGFYKVLMNTIRNFEVYQHFIERPEIFANETFPYNYYVSMDIFGLVIFIIALIPLFLIRKFIKNVQRNEIFSVDNVTLLKKVVFFLILFGLIVLIHKYLSYYLAPQDLKITIPADILLTTSMVFTSLVLYFSLFISSIVYVFSVGVNLQHDNDLTI